VGSNTISKKTRINRAIDAPQVQLVDPENILKELGPGNHTGVMTVNDALYKAKQLGLDLVEVAPNANPPVVRIMNHGKFEYERKKTGKKQKIQKLKEIKFRPGTEDEDYRVKLRNLIAFLGNGDKVKVTIRFKGREITHQELGVRLLERLKVDVTDNGVIDQMPKLEGRQMVMIISPSLKKQT
jgi:translation initiation factor IF-3